MDVIVVYESLLLIIQDVEDENNHVWYFVCDRALEDCIVPIFPTHWISEEF